MLEKWNTLPKLCNRCCVLCGSVTVILQLCSFCPYMPWVRRTYLYIKFSFIWQTRRTRESNVEQDLICRPIKRGISPGKIVIQEVIV